MGKLQIIKTMKLGLVTVAMLCIGEQHVVGQNYHAKKAMNYLNIGWTDSAFREALAGEQAGEVSSANILFTCYMNELGTPRNVTKATQLIEKWYSRSYDICEMAITFYSTNDLNNYLSDGCRIYDRDEQWRGNVKPSLAQSLKFSKTIVSKWLDKGYTGACVVFYCYLNNYTAGGDLKKIIIDKNLRPDIIDSYLRYKLQHVSTFNDISAIMSRVKSLPDEYYGSLIKYGDSNLLINNTDLQIWNKFHEVWNKFLSDNNIETVDGRMTDAGVNAFKEVYRKADVGTKAAIDYYVISGNVDCRIMADIPEFNATRKLWTAISVNKVGYITFVEIIQNPLCDIEYIKNNKAELYDQYLKAKAEEERIAEERRKQREQRLAEMRKRRIEQARNNICSGLETLKNLKGVKFWGADVVIGSDYETNNNNWTVFDADKNTLVNCIKSFLPIESYDVIEEPVIDETNDVCSCTFQITKIAKKKKKEVYRLKAYFTNRNKIDVAKTFDMENNAKLIDQN